MQSTQVRRVILKNIECINCSSTNTKIIIINNIRYIDCSSCDIMSVISIK